MRRLPQLFENNRAWAERIKSEDPAFFEQLSKDQQPEYLWIGCADSRVPANEIVGLPPGDLFVHRNIANVVVHSDLNCQSVIQYAVEVLKVKHVIVCGHYGCGGVRAAVRQQSLGLIDNWLRHIKDVYDDHRKQLSAIEDEHERVNALCELNVKAQVMHVCQTPFVQRAWEAGRDLSVHGWIYDLGDGLLKDLGVCITEPSGVSSIFDFE